MPDMSFEQKFGRLADTQLNEKLPSLVNYRVGFQVIDKDEDETRAVGVAGYLMNNVWLYVPVFFLDGDLKGLDLLYVKQRDIFVPAMDNWVTALSEHGLTTLGQSRDDSLGEEADMYFSPEATNLFHNFQEVGKVAFDANSILDQETWDKMRATMAKVSNNAGTLDDIPKLGKTASRAFVNTFLKNTDFTNALFRFYDPDQLQKIAGDCALDGLYKEADQGTKVEFFTEIGDKKKNKDLKRAEKELLIRHGVFIRDNRTNFSKIFHEEIDTGILQNPAQPGIYDVLLEDGKYKTYIILFPKDFRSDNVMFRQRKSNTNRLVAMIDPKKPEEYVVQDCKEIYGRPAVNITKQTTEGIQGGRKATLQVLAELPEGTSLLFVQDPKTCVETQICQQRKTDEGNPHVFVKNTAGNTSWEGMDNRMGRQLGEARVEFTGELGRLKLRGDTLFVPDSVRVFVNIPEWVKRQQEYEKKHPEAKIGDKRDARSLGWGTPETIHQLAFKQAGLTRLDIEVGGQTVGISCAGEYTGLLPKVAALKHLILDHGIQAGQAIGLIKEASRETTRRKTFMIKHAGAYDLRAYGRSKKPFMGGPSGTNKNAVEITVDRKEGRQLSGAKASDNSPMLPQQAIDHATQAANTGIKEVFDTSVLSGLVDKADVSELRKDYITDMVRGMDKVGRMMFLFYWHRDEFEERYGKEDLQKMEDTMKKVFAATGDLVLFLKEKTAYSPDSTESLFGNLSEDVATADAGDE